jgi:hypothetical protein
MRILLLALSLFYVASIASACDRPSGSLSEHLGQFPVIKGVKEEKGKVPTSNLRVTEVNGNELKESVVIHLKNVRTVPANTEFTLRGYETGEMIGLPGGVAVAEDLMGGSAEYQFYRYFIVTSVVAPELELEPKWTKLDDLIDTFSMGDIAEQMKAHHEKIRLNQTGDDNSE